MTKGYVEADDPRYQIWIDKNVTADPHKAMGQCRSKAVAMAKAFPELTVAGTSYHGFAPGSEHCWCVTEDMKVVDPTAHQFGSSYPYTSDPMYEPDFPTGKCWICGQLNYPDTERNRRHFEPEELGDHEYCLEEMRREFEQIDEEGAA